MPLSELHVSIYVCCVCLVIGSAGSLGKIRLIEFYKIDATE